MKSVTRRRPRGLLVLILAAGLMSFGLVVTVPVAQAADTDVVDIPDAVLHGAVNSALGSGRGADRPVTVAEAESLTSLIVIQPEGVSDLTGLEAFTRLTTLSVSGNRTLTDASPLTKLPLTTLALTGGALQGTLDSIGSLTTLTTLTLNNDRLFDVSPLAGLNRLRELRLTNNQIADISPLRQLTTVTWFDLSSNRITDVSPVSGMTNPNYLYVSDNRIADIGPLARYSNSRLGTNAGSLAIDGNRVGDLAAFIPFVGKPISGGQSIYAGIYRAGGVQVPLVRADSRGLPITVTNPGEGTYDRQTGMLTLTDPAAGSIGISPSWTVHLSDAPTDPTVVGTPVVGQTLRASGGSVVKATCEPRFQWQREGVDIASSPGDRYLVTAADIGSRLTIRVTCGGHEGISAPTSPVSGTTAGAPAIVASQGKQAGVVGDPTNPGITINVGQTDAMGNRVAPSRLTVTATSDAPSVIAASGISIDGSGPVRTVSFSPVGRGYANLTLTVTGPDGTTSSAAVQYGSSIRTTPTSRVLIGQGDSSTALPAGDGYLFVADDERSEIGLYDPKVSGAAAWESETLLAGGEIDFEASARQGDTMWWLGSHGNKKNGELQSSRQVVYETKASGTGKDARLTKTGSYQGLRTDLIAWDRSHGDRLGLAAATADGIAPDLARGFNLEGAEFSPDGSELYLGFRSPVVVKDGKQLALIVPVKNLPALTSGKASKAQFAEPILLDLDGHDIREIRKNDAGQYLIVSGTPGMWTPQSTQMMFAWTGYAEDPAVPLTTEVPNDLEPFHTDNAGAWEGIGELPDDLTAGSQVRLIMDQGYDALYDAASDNSENKKSNLLLRKARTDVFTLTGNLGLTATVTTLGPFPDQAAHTVGSPQVVTVTNTGSERVRVGRVYVEGGGEQASDFLISQNTCAHTDPGPGASCRVAIRFAPAQESATSRAQLVIESNLAGASRTVELSGTSTTLPKGDPGKDGADGAPGAPGTIITRTVKPAVAVKALSKRRLQVIVSAKGSDRRALDRRLFDQRVAVTVAGVKGIYSVRLAKGRGIIRLTGGRARALKAGTKVRVTVVVPQSTRRVATSSTLVTDYTVSKTSKRQRLTVRG